MFPDDDDDDDDGASVLSVPVPTPIPTSPIVFPGSDPLLTIERDGSGGDAGSGSGDAGSGSGDSGSGSGDAGSSGAFTLTEKEALLRQVTELEQQLTELSADVEAPDTVTAKVSFIGDMELRNILDMKTTVSWLQKKAAQAPDFVFSGGDDLLQGPVFSFGEDGAYRTVCTDAYNVYFDSDVLTTSNCRGTGGSVTKDVSNLIGLTGRAIGNHEFDAGPAQLAKIMTGGVRNMGSWAANLSANLDVSDVPGLVDASVTEPSDLAPALLKMTASDLALAKTNGDLNFPSTKPFGKYTTYTTSEGVKVGFIGVTTPILATISKSDGTSILPFGVDLLNDPNLLPGLAREVLKASRAVRSAGAQIVVLASHAQNRDLDVQLAALVDVDVIISAGSGSPYDPPKEVTNLLGKPCAVVEPKSHLEQYQDVSITKNTKTGVCTFVYYSEDTELTAYDYVDSTDAAVARDLRALKVLSSGVVDNLITYDTQIRGYTAIGLLNGRTITQPSMSDYVSDAKLYFATPANIIASAQADVSSYDLTNAAHIASVFNAGGVRISIGSPDPLTGELGPPVAKTVEADGYAKPGGAVSQLDINAIAIFDNAEVVCKTTPKGLKAILDSAYVSVAGGTSGATPRIGDARVTVTADDSGLYTVTSMELWNRVTSTWDIVDVSDDTAVVYVVANDFIFMGGDDYNFAANIDPDFGDSVSNWNGSVTQPGGVSLKIPGTTDNAMLKNYILDAFMQDEHATLETAFDGYHGSNPISVGDD